MKRIVRIAFIVGVLVSMLASPGPAHASFHLIQITDVFMGTPGAPNAQYVELTTIAANQTSLLNTKVVIYNSTGVAQQTATFSPGPWNDVSGSQGKLLVATGDAQTFFGVSADEIIGATSNAGAGGRACFEDSGGDKIDCVSWGNYSGPSGPTGNPMSPSEGIPGGASIERKELSGDPDAYDGADDSDDSAEDFRLASPNPQGGGTPSVALQRIGFSQSSYFVSEQASELEFSITRSGPTDGTKVVTFFADPGSAQVNVDFTRDYDPADPITDQLEQFNAGTTGKGREIDIIPDEQFEGPETVRMRVRNPTAGAVLATNMNATVRIVDAEDDDIAPKSRITKPEHRETYKSRKLSKLKGTASDGVGELVQVYGALRKKMKNGTCKWWDGDSFVNAACSSKAAFFEATGEAAWTFDIPRLKKSIGTKVVNYTAYSRAEDVAHNQESVFKKGRNANTFEVK